MDKDKIQKEEKELRERVVKHIRSHIEAAAMQNGTDPVLNLEYARNEFKQTLKNLGFPYSLLVVRAMIEGAIYISVAKQMGNITFPPEMSLGLLYLFEEELVKQKEERLKDINSI